MKISDKTAQKLHNAGEATTEFLLDAAEWTAPKVGKALTYWFGAAIIAGGLASAVQFIDDHGQIDALRRMRYIPDNADDMCIVVDPSKEAVVTVTAYQNSPFIQTLRGFAPFIEMAEGQQVQLGKTPVYQAAPCFPLKEGVERHENHLLARAAERANSKTLLAALEQARQDFNRTEDLTFTQQTKKPQP